MRIYRFLIPVLLLSCLVFAQNNLQLNKQTFNDYSKNTNLKPHYNFIAINNIKMWVSNDGEGSNDPTSNYTAGFYWPGGKEANKTSIFRDLFIYGAKANNEILFGGNHLHGGKINADVNAPPEKYRVYKIIRDWDKLPPGSERESRKKDYFEWPIEDGAPYEDLDADGKPTPGIDKPKFLGDETLWYVNNDLNISYYNSFGFEFQVTVFGYKRANILGDVVFKKYKIINMGNNNLTDMYISYYSDPDIGDLDDDYVGCDTLLNLGYAWNSENYDDIYGTPPPAVGYTIIQGPAVPGEISDTAFRFGRWEKGFTNLPMAAFMINIVTPCWQCEPIPNDPIEYYNYVQGLTAYGEKIINPVTGTATNKLLSGDPVSGNGWYEGEGWPDGLDPGDRRMYLSSGPFNFAPGDTQEVVYAIHIARGTSNVSSISFLREQSKAIRDFYYSEFSKPETITPVQNVPEEYKLEQNYPNPFNPGTVIKYELPYGSNVTIKVFDILGNEIETLVNEFKTAGKYEVSWVGSNYSNGVYFYQLESGGYIQTKKMVLMK